MSNYSNTPRNEVLLMPTAAWTHPENLLRERSVTQRVICCDHPFYKILRTGKSRETKSRLAISGGRAGGEFIPGGGCSSEKMESGEAAAAQCGGERMPPSARFEQLDCTLCESHLKIKCKSNTYRQGSSLGKLFHSQDRGTLASLGMPEATADTGIMPAGTTQGPSPCATG